MEQAGPAFSSNAQDVIGRHVDVQLLGPAEDVMKEYDVMVTAEWINCHSFKRVHSIFSLQC